MKVLSNQLLVKVSRNDERPDENRDVGFGIKVSSGADELDAKLTDLAGIVREI